jgi:hypothetical protein
MVPVRGGHLIPLCSSTPYPPQTQSHPPTRSTVSPRLSLSGGVWSAREKMGISCVQTAGSWADALLPSCYRGAGSRSSIPSVGKRELCR